MASNGTSIEQMTLLVAVFTMAPQEAVEVIIAAWTDQVDVSAETIRDGI